MGVRSEEAVDFLLGDNASADDYDRAAGEFYEHGKKAHLVLDSLRDGAGGNVPFNGAGYGACEEMAQVVIGVALKKLAQIFGGLLLLVEILEQALDGIG